MDMASDKQAAAARLAAVASVDGAVTGADGSALTGLSSAPSALEDDSGTSDVRPGAAMGSAAAPGITLAVAGAAPSLSPLTSTMTPPPGATGPVGLVGAAARPTAGPPVVGGSPAGSPARGMSPVAGPRPGTAAAAAPAAGTGAVSAAVLAPPPATATDETPPPSRLAEVRCTQQVCCDGRLVTTSLVPGEHLCSLCMMADTA
jgi:hypothetical protein